LNRVQVHYTDAIRIALELKKALVDRETLDTTQAAMEEVLFTIVKSHGYGDETIRLYRMVSRCAVLGQLVTSAAGHFPHAARYSDNVPPPRAAPSFHHQRIPLIVLIGGAACVGKSTLATQLAERLNLSSVLQTDVAYALMASITKAATAGRRAAAGGAPRPSLRRQAAALAPDADEATALTALYNHECALVERGVAGALPSRSQRARRWSHSLQAMNAGGGLWGCRAGGRVHQVPHGG